MAVEVLEVRRGDDAELLEQVQGQRGLAGDGLTMRGHQLREDVTTVDVHGADPREVIQAHLVDDHLVRLEPEVLRERALEADRHVAETDGAVACVEQRAGDDPDRVREVDDPRVRGGELLDALGDLEHDGHGAQRFREAAGAGRLLADAAAGKRHRLVREPRRLAADPDLDEDEVGAVERAVELAGDLERAVEALALEHPRGEPADDVPPLGVDVVQDELPDPIRSFSRESPDTSSGVYVEPPPMTAIFNPSPPSG